MADRGLYTSLLVFATFCYKVCCLEMNMAPDAVDDAYSACREKMLQEISAQDGILQKELKENSLFQREWSSSSHCQKTFPGVQKEHSQALQTFGNSDSLSKTFNKAVKTKGGDVDIYTDQFQFKSLHFLLMDAMHLLKNDSQCRTVYSGISQDYTAVKGDEVRFGSFFSAESDRSFAQEGCADEGTLFNITSCSVIDLEKYACSPEHTVLIISPAEVFQVVDVKTKGSDCLREIVLKSSGFKNNHDCYLFPRAPTTSVTTALTTLARDDSSAKGSSPQWVLLTAVLHICLIFLAL